MRPTFLLAVSTLIACSCTPSAPTEAARTQRPNIIYIMADDLGYADLGCYGQKLIRTPHIDRMAAEGRKFPQCYAGNAVCAPSRSSLMTGLHPGHTTVRNNFAQVGGVPPQGRVPLRAEDVTVAEVLKKAGYATGITGKWGLGEPDTSGVPNRQGFNAWFGYLNQRHAHTYYPEYLWKNEEKITLEGNLDGRREQYTHDMFTRFGLDFIKRHRAGPFFLFMSYTIPHGKYEVPDDAPYSDKDWPEKLKNYAAMVTRLDGDVGKMLSLLKELGIDDDTIVFFTSDNGAAFVEPTFNSSGRLRDKKGSLYEGGIRVPMIARWPGRIEPGSVSRQVWTFWDFLPTAAALAGVAPPENIDGISVVPALLSEKTIARDFLYWEFPTGGYKQAVRHGRFKAVRNRWGAPLELYDLDADPSETSDIAAAHPEVVARIEAHMKSAHVASPHWPTPDEK